MNIKSEYRKYKIAKLFDINYQNELFDFAVSKLTGLICYKHDYYPNTLIFGKSKKELLFDYDTKTGYLYIDHDELWTVFKSKYSLNEQKINDLCECILRTAYKLKVVTTRNDSLLDLF